MSSEKPPASEMIIVPYVSVGPIKLGMTRDQVRAALASTPREFQKGFDARRKNDAFEDRDLHVHYRDESVCDAVALWEGSKPILDGLDLMSMRYPVLLDKLRRLDPDLEVDASSFISRACGVSISGSLERATPECVFVFERGYYDKAM
jgi:hypothetical protein